jgi:hypothetical protein
VTTKELRRRVDDDVGEEQFRVRPDRTLLLIEVVLVLDERGLDAGLGKPVLEQAVGER